MKNIIYLGDSQKLIKEFSPKAKMRIAHLLNVVSTGVMPSPQEFKYMATVGTGVYELRVKAEMQYRVFYVAKFEEAVYVLHAFSKKTQQTSQHDIEIGVTRYKALMSLKRKSHE